MCLEFSDHCLNEAFNASCPDGKVVLITEARFGRMRPGRCIGGAFNVGCYKDIKRHLDALCTTRSRCDVSVRDLVDLHPCQRDFVSYLEAAYVCVEGMTVPVIRTSDVVEVDGVDFGGNPRGLRPGTQILRVWES